MRMDDHRDIHRIPPRDRDHMPFDRPGRFFGPDPHYFGYRVNYLPPHLHPVHYWGYDYYVYNHVYYRHFGDHYFVCRPPFGIRFDRALYELELHACRFAFYHNIYHTYSVIDSNYDTIIEQNRIIAENNARIAEQNASLALNATSAASSYDVAEKLGLIQSYAYADKQYYYDDGVFFIKAPNGEYEVIVPPAGALVNELPDDYDVITLAGVEYYKVDDTVYRLVLVDGSPYLEVLGQMPASLAAKYNLYK